MSAGYLLNRVLLQFKDQAVPQDLSAVILVGDQLWLGGDEGMSIERLSRMDSLSFGDHQSFPLEKLLDNFDPNQGEVDIEGIAYEKHCLWIIGSHSTKRKKVKNNQIDRLMSVKAESNRYLLARIPIHHGELCSSRQGLTAACLERNKDGNSLMSALKQDDYFAPFLADLSPEHPALPGKDNGFDIEGLAVYHNRLFIGLRGPVLRGMAVILEIEVEESKPGQLVLKSIGKGNHPYKKHFLDLDGFGIRDLRPCGHDLLVLAGPTMDLDGTISLYRLKHGFDLGDCSLSHQDNGGLERLFDIPHGRKTDRAEGICLFPVFDRSDTIMTVYDSPAEERQINHHAVFADVFTLT